MEDRMNKRIVAIVSLCAAVCFAAVVRAGDDQPSAADILKKVRETEASLKNYSYVVHRFDLADEFVQKRHEEGLKAFKGIIDRLSIVTGKSKEPPSAEGYKEGITTYYFIKPLSVYAIFDKSDYVPSFLEKSKFVYRPDINDEEIFLKEPILGLLIGQPVENDTAALLYSNWTYDLMEIDCALANGGELKYAGTDTYNGKKTYMIEITVNKGKEPWRVGCGGKIYGVPKNVYTQFNRENKLMMDRIEKYKGIQGKYRYWIDAGSWLIVRKVLSFGDTIAIKQSLDQIKLNKVKPEDMLMPRKKKK
jgi:hypothetical protein